VGGPLVSEVGTTALDDAAAAAVAELVERLTANRSVVHGPLPHAGAGAAIAALAVERAGGAEVALPLGDPLLDGLGLAAAVRDLGASVLTPDRPDWRTALAVAGTGVGRAVVGAADRGNVALVASTGSPRALTLVPPTAVLVLATADVAPTFAEAFAWIARPPLPSGIAWVSGPSRTGDLEMILTFGVHGPRSVDVVLVAAAG
jgi:L-lactate dehydrogenase complex protein LldG